MTRLTRSEQRIAPSTTAVIKWDHRRVGASSNLDVIRVRLIPRAPAPVPCTTSVTVP